MERKEWYTRSANGNGKIYSVSYRDETIPAKAMIVIVHGMQSHSGRYIEYAEKLAKDGFVVFMLDLQGHGRSQNVPGYFGPINGWENLVRDVHRLVLRAKRWYPELPLFLLGHSMGSFIARSYVVTYPEDIQGLLLSGTAGFHYHLYAAQALIRTEIRMHGGKYPAYNIGRIMAKQFNRYIQDPVNAGAWCCSDPDVCISHAEDPLGTCFTLRAYDDMLHGLISIRPEQWAAQVPDIPIYLFSGGADPVGDYGVGPAQVYAYLKSTGHHDVSLRIYPGKRHEMLFETNKAEVMNDVKEWLLRHLG